MQKVYKYPIGYEDRFSLTLPRGSDPLYFDVQNNAPTLWVLVWPEETVMEERVFRMAGTGHPITDGIKSYIGSTMEMGGALVWHLFEVY